MHTETRQPDHSTIAPPQAVVGPVRPAIENWDFDRLRRYLLREGVEDVDNKIKEYKRFMELNARFPELRFPMSAPVDPVWHAHVLSTDDYARFCKEAIGMFVSHRPCLDDDELGALMPDYLRNTIGLYKQTFGESVPDAYWPEACVCKCCGN